MHHALDSDDSDSLNPPAQDQERLRSMREAKHRVHKENVVTTHSSGEEYISTALLLGFGGGAH